MEKWRPKNGSIPSRNKKELEAIWRSVTDKQTERQSQLLAIIDSYRLGAEINRPKWNKSRAVAGKPREAV